MAFIQKRNQYMLKPIDLSQGVGIFYKFIRINQKNDTKNIVFYFFIFSRKSVVDIPLV